MEYHQPETTFFLYTQFENFTQPFDLQSLSRYVAVLPVKLDTETTEPFSDSILQNTLQFILEKQ